MVSETTQFAGVTGLTVSMGRPGTNNSEMTGAQVPLMVSSDEPGNKDSYGGLRQGPLGSGYGIRGDAVCGCHGAHCVHGTPRHKQQRDDGRASSADGVERGCELLGRAANPPTTHWYVLYRDRSEEHTSELQSLRHL